MRPPGDFFTFNQQNIKYLYVIWRFLHIRPYGFPNIPSYSIFASKAPGPWIFGWVVGQCLVNSWIEYEAYGTYLSCKEKKITVFMGHPLILSKLYPKKPESDTVMTASKRELSLPWWSEIHPKRNDPNNIPNM